jgi:hypothetical protein
MTCGRKKQYEKKRKTSYEGRLIQLRVWDVNVMGGEYSARGKGGKYM